MMGTRIRLAGAVVALVAAFAAVVAAPAQARTTCPSTFQVLHDDRIGALQLPAGAYRITVFDANRLSCTHASDLFRQFLEDFDGRLPGGWRVNPTTSSFNRGAVGFQVARVGSHSGGGGGRHPVSGASCPGFFRVMHDDHIGALSLPRGQYRITLLAVGRLSCARASTLFAKFLEDFDGVLPGAWRVDPETATFQRSRHVGFRVKPASGTPVDPNGGGGTHINNAGRCPDTFRVLHNDRIGRLQLPAGRYWITILRAPRPISCARAASLFTRFLQDFDGALPSPWVVNPGSASFTRGKNARAGFRVKPVSPRV